MQRKGEVQGEPLKAAAPADQNTHDKSPETGADSKDIADVAGLGDGEVVYDLEVRCEVCIPAIEADEYNAGEDASA